MITITKSPAKDKIDENIIALLISRESRGLIPRVR